MHTHTINCTFYTVIPTLYVFLDFSYCHESGDEIEAETEFLYDLELPEEFVATPHDGEVERYYLWDMERVRHFCCLIHQTERYHCACILV